MTRHSAYNGQSQISKIIFLHVFRHLPLRHLGGGTRDSYTGGEETLTAIAPAPATAPRPWTAAAREPSDSGPHNNESTAARRHDQPRRGDPTNSPGREPRDTDPHEIPSSAVSAAQSLPRPRRQPPVGSPCTRTPMAPIESSQKQPKEAKRGHDRQARPRTIHDSGFHGFLNHGSQITDHGRFRSAVWGKPWGGCGGPCVKRFVRILTCGFGPGTSGPGTLQSSLRSLGGYSLVSPGSSWSHL